MSSLNKNYTNFKKKRNKCLSCRSNKLRNILDLGMHSFADRFIKKNDLNLKDPVYPLVIDLCRKCGFVQSKYVTDPGDRYLNYEYSYTSSNSNYSKQHWRSFAFFLNKNFNLKDKKIIEIGSNDGFLSIILKKFGAKVWCVDASPKMIKISRSKGLKSIRAIFNKKVSNLIKKKVKEVDFVIANNVFNHSDNPSDFLAGVYNLLKKQGLFIFEQPYFLSTLLTKRFDQIYHEHISYFTAKNINNLLKLNKFQIYNIFKNNYHGGSIRTFALKGSKKILTSSNLNSLKNLEKKNKIYNINFYNRYFQEMNIKKLQINKKIEYLKQRGYKIFGIGAGAKSNTFLTFNNLDSFKIDFITDASNLKIGKYTPLTRIKICNDVVLKKFKKISCIILSWNIEGLIKKKLLKINKKIQFIKI